MYRILRVYDASIFGPIRISFVSTFPSTLPSLWSTCRPYNASVSDAASKIFRIHQLLIQGYDVCVIMLKDHELLSRSVQMIELMAQTESYRKLCVFTFPLNTIMVSGPRNP